MSSPPSTSSSSSTSVSPMEVKQGGDSLDKILAWVSAWKRIEILFWLRDMSKLPIFEHFLSVGNFKPKLKWFFKPKFKPIFFYWIGPQRQVVASSPGVFGRVRMALVGGLETAFCKYGEFAAKWVKSLRSSLQFFNWSDFQVIKNSSYTDMSKKSKDRLRDPTL